MTLFKPYSYKILIICTLCITEINNIFCQFSWDVKDPVDIGTVDLGDNKVILYNVIGLGIVHFLSKNNTKITSGKRYHSLSAEWMPEYRKQPLTDLFAIKFRNGWQWKKGIYVGYEFDLFLAFDQKAILGVGMSPFFSWNIINKNKWRLAYDNGVGPLYFLSTFPEGGTRFNFFTFYGLHIEYKSKRNNIGLGIRNTHISNASIAGKEKNPSFDGLGLYFQLRY